MGIKNVTPYLSFDGQSADAIAFYTRTLGATVDSLQRFAEVPGAGTAADADRVMHAQLRVDGHVMMISDARCGEASAVGGNIQLVLDFDDLDDMRRRFGALAESGTVTTAIHETFWGAHFGALRDAFGVNWLFNCQKAG